MATFLCRSLLISVELNRESLSAGIYMREVTSTKDLTRGSWKTTVILIVYSGPLRRKNQYLYFVLDQCFWTPTLRIHASQVMQSKAAKLDRIHMRNCPHFKNLFLKVAHGRG